MLAEIDTCDEGSKASRARPLVVKVGAKCMIIVKQDA